MSASNQANSPQEESAQAGHATPPTQRANVSTQQLSAPRTTAPWWVAVFVQPTLFLVCGAMLIAALGVAQRFGIISAGGGGHAVSAAGANTRYICPMMCTPPQAEPGRCPVCAMELVPATSSGTSQESNVVQIEPAARRLANIQTVAVESMPLSRTIRAVGELNYDEGNLKTISAYVDGRLDRLYADFTGVVVKQGEQLALVYSPILYSSQAELLLARQAEGKSHTTGVQHKLDSRGGLYESARERLLLLGMTEEQITQLERAGKASSRMHLVAPISGTVIEKFAVEGQYVKEGDPIYKLADLSTVWLMLRLFPEDAALIRYGQRVEVQIQSLPGHLVTGRVAFVDPTVDAKTRTVGVRVVLANDEGQLRVGDYARANIEVALTAGQPEGDYDPELAGKWISPRHPHVIQSKSGECPICGVPLVPATQFGYSEQPVADLEVLIVPRDAILRVGSESVVYVETKPGRFELRRVAVGPASGDRIVVLGGLKAGEQVAARGNFLIDSQMQLAGNPSLIDPTRAEAWVAQPPADPLSPEEIEALAALPPADRHLAERQLMCPVADNPLGSMGTPPKVDVKGIAVFICCEGCRQRLLANPEKYLAKLPTQPASMPGAEPPRPASASEGDSPEAPAHEHSQHSEEVIR